MPTKEEWAMITAGLPREIKRTSEASIREVLAKDPANAKVSPRDLGPLSTGCGARPTAFGPWHAFGIQWAIGDYKVKIWMAGGREGGGAAAIFV